MQDIRLTATSRANLSSLNETTSLANRTQGRLSTGLKVASAIDDATAYFASKALSDRASDLTSRKGDIDQGISALKAASTATEAAEKILKQVKGVVLSVKTADDTTKADLSKQFTELVGQLNSLVADSSYQGTNLVNGTAASLTVQFSESTAAQLTINGRDLRIANILSSAGGGAGSVQASVVLTSLLAVAGFSAVSPASLNWQVDTIAKSLDYAISQVRAASANIGSNITLLQTRSDFTAKYTQTLTEGSDKLTLADLNEEGANLVALQTRQQLALKALSFAGQSQQAILSLLQ